ncbi:PEP-CTERM sorting domain-containing protein [bacterium]|nr:PEP-CTERM sorting domain-containing protein [bacterium]
MANWSNRNAAVSRRLVLAFLCVWANVAGAADITENFDNVTDLASKGWFMKNLSDPLGVTGWFQGNADLYVFDAQAGPVNSYLAANFENVADVGTISNWAITPTNVYHNGDTFSFWTRTETASEWGDRMEVRMSTNGASVDTGSTALSVGDFSTLLLSINPDMVTTGYPDDWTKYTITLSGLAGATTGRIAFRYFVTDAGPNGDFGNYIGIDTLQITTVPEPSTYALAAIGVLIAGVSGRRRRKFRITRGEA